MRFSGKVVIVTGGGQGIGGAVCRSFAAEGVSVVIADIDEEAGKENEALIRDAGGTAYFVRTDVAVEKDVMRLASEAVKQFGRIDIVINNAGIGTEGTLFENPVDAFDHVLAVNLRGPYMMAKYCGQEIARVGGGCIIHIASTRAFMSEANTEPYSASKGGLVALTHALAMSLSSMNIRVMSISPGWIDVSSWQKSSKACPDALSERDHLQHPARRVGTPLDIANACMYLCSEDAGFMTGTNVMIDGGMTVKMIYE